MARNASPFICVGPERTGTTWLYVTLGAHPDVFLPPQKELRYFSERLLYPGERWFERLSRHGDWHTQHYRQYLRTRLLRYLSRPHQLLLRWRQLRWDWRYLFGEHDDDWYRSTFELGGGRHVGDISPQYFFLPEPEVAHMASVVPGVRIILLLRDPVDWCWSFARLTQLRGREIDPSVEDELIEWFEERMPQYRITPTVEKWQRGFPADRVFVGFYDQLRDAPDQLFRSLCEFLGLDAGRLPGHVQETLAAPVNPGPRAPLPARFAARIARGCREDLDRLAELLPSYPARWLERHSELLRSSER